MTLTVTLRRHTCSAAMALARAELTRTRDARLAAYPKAVAAGRMARRDADTRRLGLEDAIDAVSAIEQALWAREHAAPGESVGSGQSAVGSGAAGFPRA